MSKCILSYWNFQDNASFNSEICFVLVSFYWQRQVSDASFTEGSQFFFEFYAKEQSQKKLRVLFLFYIHFESPLISLIEINLKNYHECLLGEAFAIIFSNPILNRQIKN